MIIRLPRRVFRTVNPKLAYRFGNDGTARKEPSGKGVLT
jgi:hypothetical protein